MSRMIGIDLGTTNSCVAVMDGGEKVIIPTAEGARTTPSVVAFTKNGERLVGAAAQRQAAANPARTISSIKRQMGTATRMTIDGRSYSPEEISAFILMKLKKDAEDYLGESVRDAVITVPAYFTDAQRQATRDAGTIAGLNVLRVLNEPTAAALAYGVDKEVPQKIMVFDLGGGTFDVSILDINGGMIEVLATAGNNHLGGDDFDAALAHYFADEFYHSTRIDITGDPAAMRRVREAAEQAKITLSAASSAEVQLPYLAIGRDGVPLHLETTVTRALFDNLTRPLVDATRPPVSQALRDARLTPQDLSKVILVGGASRIPAVQAMLRELTGKEGFKGINPDECVAMGACLQAGVLSGEVHGLLLLDVTPLSLGVETVGGVFTKIIDRNTTLPISCSKEFTTAANFQSTVEIHVLQGESSMARQNKTLGRFHLHGIRRAMRGVPKINVTFSIDANGIVSVSAQDMATGNAQEITITGSTNLSPEEIQRAIYYAARPEAQGPLDAQQISANAQRALRDAQQALHSMDRATKKQVRTSMKELKRALKQRNPEDIRVGSDRLYAALAQSGR